MHELGIMTGVMESVEDAARQAGATRVTRISLNVGVMTEAVEDALRFAFEALSEGTICEGAQFQVTMIEPESVCLECGADFVHDRFHVICPECGSAFVELVRGRELAIDSIEVDLPDDNDDCPDAPSYTPGKEGSI